jgi:hypothetical protein
VKKSIFIWQKKPSKKRKPLLNLNSGFFFFKLVSEEISREGLYQNHRFKELVILITDRAVN